MRILAGDIGGTKTRLGLFESDGGRLILDEERSYASADHRGFAEIIREFSDPLGMEIDSACFGIAGPVTGRRVAVTNLPWVVDADEFESTFGIKPVLLLNDLEATAWGLFEVAAEDLHLLNPGLVDTTGNAAVIAAGTGLGEAGLYWNGRVFAPFGCEGGHTSFSPTDEIGDGLLRFLREKYETVSWERVLSGPGLADLYRYLLEIEGRDAPRWFVAADEAGDPVPAISAAAIAERCRTSVRALKVFCRLYGEEAGNLALKLMATGGVWVGGGIAPKVLPVLAEQTFMAGFLDKGRMRPLLEKMPVRVVLDDRAALLGAARYAANAISQ